MSTKDHIEIKTAQLMIQYIKRGYGANCQTRDIDDFSNDDISNSRCPSCKAREVVDWLEEHIKLIELA